jgi:hypothetical protein
MKDNKLLLKQGDIWHGKEVETIHAFGQGYIIYSFVGEDSCSWYHEGVDERVDENLRLLSLLLAKVSYKFKGVMLGVINRHVITTVKAIFAERNNPNAVSSALAALDAQIELLPKIDVVVARNERFKVWVTEDDRIVHHINKQHLSRELGEIVQAFKVFESFALAMLPAKNHSLFYRRLAAEFAGRLESAESKTRTADYDELKSYVIKIVENDLKVRYLLIAFSITFAFLIIALCCYKLNIFSGFFQHAIVSMSGGVLGAFISVLERSKKIVVNEYESGLLIATQCFVRVFLGGILGLISLAAVISGIAFTVFGTTSAALLLLGVASGFSERLIPELIEGISMQRNISKNT